MCIDSARNKTQILVFEVAQPFTAPAERRNLPRSSL